jgi:hypothetical protein
MIPILASLNEFVGTPIGAPLDGSIKTAKQITSENIYKSKTQQGVRGNGRINLIATSK